MQVAAAFMILFVAAMAYLGQWRSMEWTGQPIAMGETSVQDLDTARANAYAANLALYHQAAVRYAGQNPGFVGSITAANLAPLLSAQYQALASWTSVVAAGRDVVTYGPIDTSAYRGQTPQVIGLELARLTGFPVGAGTVQGSVVASPHLRPTGATGAYYGAPLPASLLGTLPNGAPVRVSRIP